MPLAKLLEALTLPANTNPATELKSLVADGKIAEVTTVRDAVKVLKAKWMSFALLRVIATSDQMEM